MEKGKLLPALKASIAVPGMFAPVKIDNRVLLDGGLVDLVPYEHILGRCAVSIAVNVAGFRTPGITRTPSAWESVLGSFLLIQEATLSEKMKRHRPDIYVHPEIIDVPLLAFGKTARVFRETAPAVQAMKKRLRKYWSIPKRLKRRIHLMAKPIRCRVVEVDEKVTHCQKVGNSFLVDETI